MRAAARRAAALVVSLFALAAPTALGADAAAWRVVRGDVRVTCPMTVGGSFEARTAAIQGTLALPEAAGAPLSGELAADLASLDTGIGLRDEHLKDRYLEVGRGAGFDRAVLSQIRLDAAPEGFQGKTRFTGTFLLHGTTKPVSGPATIRREGSSVRVEASFAVVVADYGIEKPQYLGVGVQNEVEVQVSLVAEPAAGPRAGR
jgi:polyisoprenoid-binding protein YceI